jgi:PTH1 family peptidyl-tRNA hydrolase
MIRRMKQWLLIGLGNPGSRYEKTRHNVGKRAVRFWQEQMDVAPAMGVAVFFPQTGMNESGKEVAAYVRAHNFKLEHIILVHDDVELPFGEVRFKEGGSAAGHNGVRSVQAVLGTDMLGRIRIGVGRSTTAELHDYVLQPFTAEEEAQLPAVLTVTAQVLEQRLSRE